MMLPDGLAASDQTSPAPLPPVAPKLIAPFGGVLVVAEVIEILVVIVTLLVATLPRESVTCTTSVTPSVIPAVYVPFDALMLAPEALLASDQAYAPLPPLAVNVWRPPVASIEVPGEMVRAVIVTVAVADAPFESITFTMSFTPPVLPATYAPLDALILAPEASVASDQVNPVPLPPEAVKV